MAYAIAMLEKFVHQVKLTKGTGPDRHGLVTPGKLVTANATNAILRSAPAAAALFCCAVIGC